MKNVLLILLILLTFSCNKSQIKNPRNINKSLSRKYQSIQSQNRMQTKLITYERIKNMPMEDATIAYPPIEDETFILGKEGGFITEFRIGLLNLFKEEEIKNNNIKIKEITWKINVKQNLTIWYQEINNRWKPIDHFIWDKDAEF
ncbi:hypothetical protein Ga0061079_10250 [Apibacter mensalis]|uniref:Lipoprotein n=1 Tax=Apibacter mensalis TaxID=1586267 RepID=A0A0X3AME5_9FLAO|nr:hypothetical protein [Apibacter mensalis]CVK15504.1 hypothetical protein Ga0061079_10250 [Apibacter mensalis]